MRVAGIGCRPGTDHGVIIAALEQVGGADALATIPERAPELRPVATALGLRLHIVHVAGIATPTESPRIRAAFGTGSVAEAAALALGGRLLAPRRIIGPVTIAIAEVP